MQYIKLKKQAEDVDLFSDDEAEEGIQPISHEDYEKLIEYLKVKNPPAILPIQIAYYAGLRIGEACGLTWQDINLEEPCLTIKRSIRYDGTDEIWNVLHKGTRNISSVPSAISYIL